MYVCSPGSWYTVSTQNNTGDGSVKSYPNVHFDYPNAWTSSNGVPFNTYNSVTSKFAAKPGPTVGIYDVAYDVWLNGAGWGGGTTEVMVWTENRGQRPLGAIKYVYTAPNNGAVYDVWSYKCTCDGGVNVVSFAVRNSMYAGTLDIKAMVSDAISKGYIPANPSWTQIGFGVEIVSTNNTPQRFDFTDFSVTNQ
jgi:hypothetical protein